MYYRKKRGEGYYMRSYKICYVKPVKIWDEAFLNKWREMLERSDNMLTLYQSPEWIDALSTSSKEQKILIGVLQDDKEDVEAIIPLAIGLHKLKYAVGVRTLFSIPIKVVSLLGSIPLIPPLHDICDQFFGTVLKSFPDCQAVYLDSVLVGSFLWEYLRTSEQIKNDFLIHIPDGTRSHFCLILPDSFEKYLAGFKSKRRSELKRRLKYFNESFNNETELRRIDSVHQVAEFLEKAAIISKNSWQNKQMGPRINTDERNCKILCTLANKGLLRSYLLTCRGEPCAFRISYQLGDRFVSAETGYDLKFEEYSPGKILTLRMIEDMTTYHPPKYLDFGIGNAQWKRDLCNLQLEDATIYLMRKTLLNYVLRWVHSGFFFMVRGAKKYLEWIRTQRKVDDKQST
jgi:hypothetical protein